MVLRFLGAVGGVTGSSFLVNGEVLVDLGMYQGIDEVVRLNYQPLQFDSKRLKGVVVTHAHLDHCGRLPLLVKGGFEAPIYMTGATRELAELVLRDAVKVARAERDKNKQMFTEEEVELVLKKVKVVDYGRSFALAENLKGILRDAGHILGSASLEVVEKEGGLERRVVFSGDLGNSPQDLIKPTERIERGDVVVMESTYGDRLHGDEDRVEVLAEEVNRVEKDGGVLLIPAFSLERTQELLHILDHLKRSGRVEAGTRVFLDSPMAIRATEIFKQFRDLYNQELKQHAAGDDPFDFPGLVLVERARESRKIVKEKGRKVVIGGSGMMMGGRILAYAARYLSKKSTRLLLVGYQAKGTLGRRILEGARRVRIDKVEVEVRAKVREITSMSAHADWKQLLAWLRRIKGVRQVYLVHGEERSRESLRGKIEVDLGLKVGLPKLGEEIRWN